MNAGMVTGLAALSGSLVGALGSAAGTWITQKHQDRRILQQLRIFHEPTLEMLHHRGKRDLLRTGPTTQVRIGRNILRFRFVFTIVTPI